MQLNEIDHNYYFMVPHKTNCPIIPKLFYVVSEFQLRYRPPNPSMLLKPTRSHDKLTPGTKSISSSVLTSGAKPNWKHVLFPAKIKVMHPAPNQVIWPIKRD